MSGGFLARGVFVQGVFVLKSYGQKLLGDPLARIALITQMENSPYPKRKLYSEFSTPLAVQSGRSLTLSGGGGR